MKGLAGIAVGLAIVLAFGGPAAATTSAKPISKQNCKELQKTFQKIKADEAPNKPFAVQSKAAQDASKLNDRINQLGGCLPKSASTSTPTTGPSGAPGDAGFNPTTQNAYLAQLTGDQNLASASVATALGWATTFCGDLDRGMSIAAESKTFINMFKAMGLNATDAEQAFYEVASGAADNGNLSICHRHASKVEDYNNGTVH